MKISDFSTLLDTLSDKLDKIKSEGEALAAESEALRIALRDIEFPEISRESLSRLMTLISKLSKDALTDRFKRIKEESEVLKAESEKIKDSLGDIELPPAVEHSFLRLTTLINNLDDAPGLST